MVSSLLLPNGGDAGTALRIWTDLSELRQARSVSHNNDNDKENSYLLSRAFCFQESLHN